MVDSLTSENLYRDAPKFIRDVIRNEVSALSNRVYKSQTSELEPTFPFCELDLISDHNLNLTMTHDKFVNVNLMFNIFVYAKSIKERDEITDSIIQVLKNPNSSDGTHTLKEFRLCLLSYTSEVEDSYMEREKTSSIIRIRRIIATLRYYGYQ